MGDLTELCIKFECEPEEMWARSGFTAETVEMYALQAMELAANVQRGATIDGSDMIFLPVRNGWLTPMYDLVVIDEAQDMTTAQLEIAQGVANPGGRICVVGDDRQAIFGFRGADSDSIDRLKRELGAAELGLTTTYRCGKAIVEVAKHYVADFQAGTNNPEGEVSSLPMQALFTEAGPGNYILSRVNAPLVSIAMKLLRNGKRTRIAGKDIGKGLIGLVRKFKAKSVPDFLDKVLGWQEKQTNRIQGMILKATNGKKATLQTKLGDVIDQAEMLMALAEEAKSVTEIERNIELLFTDDGLGAAGMITCSSVHKAKGLEAEKVFVLEDTLRYHSLEEENIVYVAITRAKQHLIFVSDKGDE
jgi:superfamily I DNA/RNA helicase